MQNHPWRIFVLGLLLGCLVGVGAGPGLSLASQFLGLGTKPNAVGLATRTTDSNLQVVRNSVGELRGTSSDAVRILIEGAQSKR